MKCLRCCERNKHVHVKYFISVAITPFPFISLHVFNMCSVHHIT